MHSPVQDDNSVELVAEWDDEEPDDYKPREAVIIDGKLYKPGMFLPGQSGNPKGRPKGKTLKEWCKDFLATMNDKERLEFMQGLPKEVIWRMAEGNPTEDRNVSISVPKPILGGMTQLPATVVDTMLDDTQTSEDIGHIGVGGDVGVGSDNA